MPTLAQKILRFGRFELDPNAASCRAEGRHLPLRPKSFDVLLYLARHPGRVVAKDELIEALWPGIFVTDNSLVQCISDIRAALEDEAQAIVRTVARRGYLFAASVVEVEPAPAATEPDGPAEPSRDPDRDRRDPVVGGAGSVRPWPWQQSLAIAGVGAAVVVVAWIGVHRWVATPAVAPLPSGPELAS